MGSTRRDDYRCSSMNALQLVALVESASKLRGGHTEPSLTEATLCCYRSKRLGRFYVLAR